MSTIKEILIEQTAKLKESYIEDGMLKAKILLAYVLGISKENLVINYNKRVEENEGKVYKEYIQKIYEGIPLQYITNRQEFMKLNFYVDESVLIPRQDTENLVEEILNIIKFDERYIDKKVRILDLCTGSGAIAISLAKYIKDATVYASDISSKALEIAKKNALLNNVDAYFIQSSMFKNIIDLKFDIIVSNPPYIKRSEIKNLERDVQKEPIIALDGGEDGLYFYKIIINEAQKYLSETGILALEIGYDQRKEVEELIEKSRRYKEIYCKRDLGDNDRVIICRKR